MKFSGHITFTTIGRFIGRPREDNPDTMDLQAETHKRPQPDDRVYGRRKNTLDRYDGTDVYGI